MGESGVVWASAGPLRALGAMLRSCAARLRTLGALRGGARPPARNPMPAQVSSGRGAAGAGAVTRLLRQGHAEESGRVYPFPQPAVLRVKANLGSDGRQCSQGRGIVQSRGSHRQGLNGKVTPWGKRAGYLAPVRRSRSTKHNDYGY